MAEFTLLDEEKNKFTLLEEPKFTLLEEPKFTLLKEEKPEFKLLEIPKGEQTFTLLEETYDMTPPQIRDMAKIMGSVAEAPKEPVMDLEYIPAKVYSYLVEEPLANAGALVSQGLEKGFSFLGMDKLADTQAQVTETYKTLPITESVKEQTAYLRQQAYKRGQGQGIMYDISEAGTRFGSLLVQMGALKKLPALKGGGIGTRMGTLGVHGFLTTEGDLKERLDAAQYRIVYASTPFLAQHWGATGLKSIALDSMLNTMLTTPLFVKSYNQAKETGNWDGFVSDVIVQTFMNVGMAITTTGYPKAQQEARLRSYLKTMSPKIDMSYKDLDSIVKSFDKAQNPKTPLQKQALVKQEKKLQTLMQKDDANIELEKLAADEKTSPINKLIAQAGEYLLPINEINKYKNVNDYINNQKSYYHGTHPKFAESIRKEGVISGMATVRDVGVNRVGFSVSPNKNFAREFGEEVLEFKIMPNAKIATPENLKGAKELYTKYENGIFYNMGEAIDLAKKQGFDVVDIQKFEALATTPKRITELQILNPDVLKTKEQLVDLYNRSMGIGATTQNKINNMAMELSTNQQKARVHIRAKELGLLTNKDKEKKVYQKYMESLVGEKSTKNMNQGQIKMVIDSLDKMDIQTGTQLGKTKVHKLTPELLRFVTGLGEVKDIGAVAKFRNPYEVFNAMGLLRQVYLPAEAGEISLYNDEMVYRTELKKLLKQRGITKDSKQKVFDVIENPKDVATLNPSEVKLRDFAVKFFDDWANKLKLPPEKRRDKYVTHIFEKALEDMTDKGYVDPNILRAFEFGAIPKSIKNPFIQNERTGQEYGLKRDVVEAMNVYEAYALRTFHYEPLLNKMDIYSKFLPELSRKYLGNFAGRMTNRPLDIDKGINNDVRELTRAISESPLARAPAFKKLLPLLKDQSRGNIAGTAAYYYTGLLYETALGMRPDSAIRNLGQGVLTIAESGLANYVNGLGYLTTKEGRDALRKSRVYQSRKYAYLPSQGGYVPQNVVGNVKNAMMYMFKSADKFNVSTAFSTGYQEAKSLGLPDPIAIERGDEVARKTQYMYTKMAAPEFTMTVPGKVLGVFTSWPRNWFELTRHWVRGDISEVYLNYEKMTGKKVYKEDWMSRHRAAMTYAAIYALSMYIEHETDIEATQYTGFKTMETIPRYLSGNIAGLRLPLAATQIAFGSAMRNRTMLKAGLKGINPMTWFNVLKKLDDIQTGKKDWLDMFFYRNRKRKFRLR